MKSLILSVLSLLLITSFYSCNEVKTGFAIVVDTESYDNAKAEIDAYADVLNKEGLETHLIVKDFTVPDSLKAELYSLYRAENPIEGAVFIGDVPIACVIDAQHMTSAFKMNQKRFDLETASVPTDRFYDDFDLTWNYIRQDTINQLNHYYSLSFDSKQHISPNIYSGRIKMPEVENKYELLRNYMKKVVSQHQAENVLDEFFFFAGNGYNSGSMVARLDEQVVLDQQLLGNVNVEFLDHGRANVVKFQFMSELQRDDLDIALLHHHGSEDTQYLSGWPKTNAYEEQISLVKRFLRVRLNRSKDKGSSEHFKIKQDYNERFGIPPSWFNGAFDNDVQKEDSLWNADLDLVLADFDIYDYKPNVRFAILDACFNGAFHEDEYLAGAYIFADGNSVANQANSVNSLQDKWPQEMVGLLSLGMRIGEWNRKVCYLETHIIGDPTFRFKSIDPSLDVQKLSVVNAGDNKVWLGLLDSKYPDVQALALRKLYDNGYDGISELLLTTYKNSDLGSVRTECLKLSSNLNDNNFIELLKLALSDSYELIQRLAVIMAGNNGSDELIPSFVKLAFSNLSERVEFNYINNSRFFNNSEVMAEFEKQSIEANELIKKDEALKEIEKVFVNANSSYQEVLDKITNPETSDNQLEFWISTLRNYNYHQGVPSFIDFLEKSDNEEHRIKMIEALGWFTLSVQKQQIIDYCDKLANDAGESEELRQEAAKTVLRLS